MEEIKKFDVSVILPVKSGKATNFTEYFDKCIESLKIQKTGINELVIVHTDEDVLVDYLNSYDFGNLTVNKYTWTEEPSYTKQINYGVEKSTSNWVSFYEFDDEYSSIWFKNVDKYVNAYPDVDVFLPIVIDVDTKGIFAGFTNEATFAANFSQEVGVLSHDILLEYQNFQTSGMVINREKFINLGGFKTSIKLTYGYELFLRLTNKSVKIMSIPKIGYKHLNLREGSIFWNYKNGEHRLVEDEVKFWIDSAKNESNFIQDRDIMYQSVEV